MRGTLKLGLHRLTVRQKPPAVCLYLRGAWWAGIALGTITVTASVFAGLLGPVAIAIRAVVLSLPAWDEWRWLPHNG